MITCRRLAVSGVAVPVVGVSVSLACARSWWPFTTGGQASTRAPERLTDVPTTLPEGGVAIYNVVLKPVRVAPDKAMTAAGAIRAARADGLNWTSQGIPSVALEASLTETSTTFVFPEVEAGKGRPPIVNFPAWVVTFTSPRPIYPDVKGVGPTATHFSVAINATTGKFLLGFYTK